MDYHKWVRKAAVLICTAVEFYMLTGKIELKAAEEIIKVAGWSIYNKHDRFDGESTAFARTGIQPGSSIIIFVSHSCYNRADPPCMNEANIYYHLGKTLRCPFIEEGVLGPEERVYVRWIIDNGVAHSQQYELIGKDKDSLSYRWKLLGIDGGNIDKYITIPEAYKIPSTDPSYREFKNAHVIPSEQMLDMLSKGEKFYLRANDRCESVDIEIDLMGLSEAIEQSPFGTGPLRTPHRR